MIDGFNGNKNIGSLQLSLKENGNKIIPHLPATSAKGLDAFHFKSLLYSMSNHMANKVKILELMKENIAAKVLIGGR